MRGRFISPPIRPELGSRGLNFEQADIHFWGIDQSGPSFEGRVFLNNPNADLETAPRPENGYAGSFHVFGYGLWPGDIGKDEAARAAASETTRAPIEKVLIATEAVRAAAARAPAITITVVPVFPGQPPKSAEDALKIDRAEIVIH